jgi:hypothetical protein
MAELPDRPAGNEAIAPWNVREPILSAGYASALAIADWGLCLNLNAGIAASQSQRGVGMYEVTLTRFRDAGPLIRLRRLSEAEQLLGECQQIFEAHADINRLARVFSTRAELAAAVEHRQAATDLGRTALRLCYARPELLDIAICHHNLANYLRELGGDRAGQRAHRLAAALIFRLAGMAQYLVGTVRALAVELRADDGGEALPDTVAPDTVAQVVAVAEQTDGVRLGELLAALEPDPQAVEAVLAEILRGAEEIS